MLSNHLNQFGEAQSCSGNYITLKTFTGKNLWLIEFMDENFRNDPRNVVKRGNFLLERKTLTS